MTSEREKMASQHWFNPADRELAEQRRRAKQLCRQMNQQGPEPFKAHQQLARQLFGSVGSCYIEPDFWCDYGGNIHLGQRFYANHQCIMLDAAAITIGDDVMLGPAVQIYTVSHPMAASERMTGIEQAHPVTIGNRAWVGGGAIILPGVSIGEGAVIAAGAVVNRDVAPYTLVAGQPAKLIKTLPR